MEKYGFIYLWFDRKHKRYYVGSHWGTEQDGYICSSNWMRKSYVRRPDDFKRKIIKRVYSNRIELLEEEQKYLNMIRPEEVKTRYYNLNLSVKNPWYKHPEHVKTVGQKISASRTGKTYSKRGPRTEEEKRKISERTSLAMKKYFENNPKPKGIRRGSYKKRKGNI
jgi:hypothetical protein